MSCPRLVALAVSLLLTGAASPMRAEAPFAIHVVDEATGRGVPLIELKGTSDETYITDSNGYIAIDDPGLLNQSVYFHVSGHGYEYPKDGLFGYRGVKLRVTPGGEETVPVRRNNAAQRLYRTTGAGIYRDSVKLGRPVPIQKPLLNGEVTGQDSVQAVVVGDRIYWFWGDTERLNFPLGQFNTCGAVSKLPSAGGLDPSQGVDLEYFVGQDGFCRPMFARENGILIWVHGAFALKDPQGKTQVLTHYSRRKSLTEELSAGLAMLQGETPLFEKVVEYKDPSKASPRGQSFRAKVDGVEYLYFATPSPTVRVKATWDAVHDPAQWEAYTPLVSGSSLGPADKPILDRDTEGRLNWAWKADTAVLDAGAANGLTDDGVMKEDENRLRTVSAHDGSTVVFNAGSVNWNEHRKRWILLGNQTFGNPSYLGEIWYAEARSPEGPFSKAVKIVSHDNYSFYNVAQHEFFDQQGGRLIYFEGTYTASFSNDARPTPLYDYNQIMYALDLDDERLRPAFVE